MPHKGERLRVACRDEPSAVCARRAVHGLRHPQLRARAGQRRCRRRGARYSDKRMLGRGLLAMPPERPHSRRGVQRALMKLARTCGPNKVIARAARVDLVQELKARVWGTRV